MVGGHCSHGATQGWCVKGSRDKRREVSYRSLYQVGRTLRHLQYSDVV